MIFLTTERLDPLTACVFASTGILSDVAKTTAETPATPWFVALTYLLAVPCFILALKWLSHPRTARRGVRIGELGMLLCQRGQKPFHIPTVAQEVFDVSGAGDTVIATFTLGIAAGASPLEAAILSNHAAGIVVGKVGTATTSPEELLKSFNRG